MAALITGTMYAGNVYAAEETQEFNLDPMVVTATRMEKRDVDVPASTEVLTAEDIKKSGAKSVHVALQIVTGLTYAAFGPTGSSMGTMNNDVTVRGNDNGTLVMMNGVPISWRTKYNLESISTDNIERIEVVKGSGSVLYGSEASGGVINIITKKKMNNTVSVGIGNYGQKRYGATVGNDKFGVTYSKEKWDHTVESVNKKSSISSTKDIADTRTDVKDIRRENIGLNYNINDRLTATYNYYESKATYDRILTEIGAIGESNGLKAGEQYNGRTYTTRQHIGQL